MAYNYLKNLVIPRLIVKHQFKLRSFSTKSLNDTKEKAPSALIPVGLLVKPTMLSEVQKPTLWEKLTKPASTSSPEQRQKELLNEMKRSTIQDFNEVRRFNGKLFYSPPRLFKEKSALWMYNFHGKSLRNQYKELYKDWQGSPFFFALFSNAFGENQCRNWIQHLAPFDYLPVRYANVQSNLIKYWLQKIFIGKVKRSIPEKCWVSRRIICPSCSQVCSLDKIDLFTSKIYNLLLTSRMNILQHTTISSVSQK